MKAKKKIRLSGCLLLTSLSLAFFSCQATEPLTEVCVETESRLASGTRPVVELVRQGDQEAYFTLARMYNDGDGVPQSNLNALILYGIHYRHCGPASRPYTDLFPSDHPFYPFARLVFEGRGKHPYSESIALMEDSCPIEHAALLTFMELDNGADPCAILTRLKELEDDGSELGAVFRLFYHQSRGDMDSFEQIVKEKAGQYPLFHSLLAEVYEARYAQRPDIAYLYNALEHYRLSDMEGMLTHGFARKYLRLYSQLEKLTGVHPDPDEVARLKRVFTASAPFSFEN